MDATITGLSTERPAFDDTEDPETMRTRVLIATINDLLARHAYHLAVLADAAAVDEFTTAEDAPLDVSPAAALADVITEINAYWTVETSHGPYAVEEYREIAADMWDHGRDVMAGSVAHHIAAARKAAGLSR